MASGSTQPPLVAQVRLVMITVAVVGLLLLTCGLFNLGATIWGFGRVGQVPAGQVATPPAEVKKDGKIVDIAPGPAGQGGTLPSFVKKDAKIKFQLVMIEAEGTVREVHGSWVLMKDVRNKNGLPPDRLNTWVNFNFVSQMGEQ